MIHNGKNLSLKEYVNERRKDYIGLPAYRWDEGLIWAIQGYYGSMGEFTKEDIDYIKEMGWEEIAAMCEENV